MQGLIRILLKIIPLEVFSKMFDGVITAPSLSNNSSTLLIFVLLGLKFKVVNPGEIVITFVLITKSRHHEI